MAAKTQLNAGHHISLSKYDSRILQALFNAESSISSAAPIAHTTQQSLPGIPDEEEFQRIRAIEQEIVQTIMAKHASPKVPSAVVEVKDHDTVEQIELAISRLSLLINDCPIYPSAYLNRAQALRVLMAAKAPLNDHASGRPSNGDGALFAMENLDLTTRLFSDIDCAITLSSTSDTNDAMSLHQRSVLAAAHTHRGFLCMAAARLVGEAGIFTLNTNDATSSIYHLQSKTKTELEEMASRDFTAGGRYGDPVARDMAVRTNPYAKMCGAIVKEAMVKEIVEASGRLDL